MALRVCALALAATLLAGAAAAQSKLSLDEAIEKLRTDGSGGHVDPKRKIWVSEPASEVVRAHVDAHDLTDAQWRRALVRTGVLHWRDRWPKGVPFEVSLRPATWLGSGDLTLLPRVAGWHAATYRQPAPGLCSLVYDLARGDAYRQTLGDWPIGATEVVADLVVEHVDPLPKNVRRGEEWSARRTSSRVWSGSFELRTEIVDSIDDVIAPVESDELDRAIAASITVQFSDRHPSDLPIGRSAILELDAPREARDAFTGTVVSLEIDVVHDFEIVAVVDGPSIMLDEFGDACVSTIAALPLRLERDISDRTNWSLWIRGTNHGVLDCWSATRRWSGTVLIPLATAMARASR